jgi:hypothetical protein
MRTVTASCSVMNTRSGVCKAFTFNDAAQFEVLIYICSASQRISYHSSCFSQLCAMHRFLACGSSGYPN